MSSLICRCISINSWLLLGLYFLGVEDSRQNVNTLNMTFFFVFCVEHSHQNVNTSKKLLTTTTLVNLIV